MKHLLALTCLTMAFGIWLPGCGNLTSYKDVLLPVGADDDKFYYLHFAQFDMLTDHPSSLWVVDVQTGQSRRVSEPELQHYLEVSGDYYIFPTTEQGLDGVETTSLVAVQISTGQRFTIFDGLENVSYALDGSRVAYAAGTPQSQILIFDLDARGVSKTVNLPEDSSGVWGFHGNRVLSLKMALPETTGDASASQTDGTDLENADWIPLLVNLDTDELTELPTGPEGWTPMPFGNALFGDWVVTAGIQGALDESNGSLPMSLVAWRVSTATWRVLATYEPTAAPGGTPVAFAVVNDLNATHAAVYSVTGVDWATELIDLESGERTHLTGGGAESVYGSDSAIPYCGEDAGYWVDRSTNSLVVHDVSSATRRTITLGF